MLRNTSFSMNHLIINMDRGVSEVSLIPKTHFRIWERDWLHACIYMYTLEGLLRLDDNY